MNRPRRSRIYRSSLAAVGASSLLALPLIAPSARAQDSTDTTTTTTIVHRRRPRSSSRESTVAMEAARRQQRAAEAGDHIIRGDAAFELKDYETAVKEYRIAVDSLNDSPAVGDRRSAALAKFANASLKLGEQRVVEGRYGDAESTLKVVLRPEYDEYNKEVINALQDIESQNYYNKTIGPKFIDKVEQVKQLFVDAQGFYDSARYDLAFKRCEQILALDATNIAARKFEEKIDLARYRYDEHAYDEARGRSLEEVEAHWQRPLHRYGAERDPRKNVIVQRDESGSTVAINAKLRNIIIPNIEFRQTTIRDAVEFLRQEAKRLDPDPNPDNRGVNIFLKLGSAGGPRAAAPEPTPAAIPGTEAPAPAAPVLTGGGGAVANADTRISLTLSRIPLLEALRYVATQATLKVKVEPYAVSIVPQNESSEALIQAEFRVPPGFIGNSVAPSAPSALNSGPSSATGTGSRDVTGAGAGQITRQDAKTFLEASGVTFPNGASATYVPQGSRLVVRNTQENIDLIEALVEQNAPEVLKQIEIESKFVEITQNNNKQLGFDFNLGSANIPGNHRVFVTGGSGLTPGTTAPTSAQNINSGLRTGDFAVQGNAIDALLAGGATSTAAAAPSILNIAGVFTDPQFQIVIHALNQQKGVDLLDAPRVTTKSGQKAVIEIIREFIYPTQFQPPQIPTNVGNQNNSAQVINPLTGLVTSGGSSGAFPVTPTTPTSFEKRNTGVTLDVEPVIGPDGFTIDLTLAPQVVDFDGFINYGSPIQTTSTNALGIATTNVLTQNVINQPIFSARKVTTSVSVYDGSTVVLGGLVHEDVQRVNDKVPVLGDVPLLGRLFRSKVDQSVKQNLIIFVTARLIDPSGQAINSTEEEEEPVQSLTGPEVVPAPPNLPFKK